MYCGPAVEARAELRIPADAVTPPHLRFKETRQQQALGSRRLHHLRVMKERRVGDKMIEHGAEVRGRRPVDVRLGRDLSVVCQDARVVEELACVFGWVRYILQRLKEELERLPLIDRQQFPEWTHSSSVC